MTATHASGTATSPIYFSVPGVAVGDAGTVIAILQDRLNALNDLALTLKHVHWNVVGTHFVAVHTMLDPQVETVRSMIDETAERIAALGGSPVGTPGALVAQRTWDDYDLRRANAIDHMGALDVVYAGVIDAHRHAIADTETADPVTQDMLIGHCRELEQAHWFVRAHLEDAAGSLSTAGAHTERSAAERAGAMDSPVAHR
ncbi:Dps family protein [Jongsikchunia kroppenstedtii]|uniref:Dps family protein n=1 Tax=Jongsikchunia kroppenstedtii TaxID=1121721 RepID=UPI000381DC5D|nr:DNA starvation/stationary phase protection protein [Jongsikchunia kroppenstedtii]